MSEKEACLLRSKLHIRAGKKLLDHNKITHAIGTLYDAIEYGMRWYYLEFLTETEEEFDEGIYQLDQLYNILVESDEINSISNFELIQEQMEESLEDNFSESKEEFDNSEFWSRVEVILKDLRIIPFDYGELPEEDENTRQILDIN